MKKGGLLCLLLLGITALMGYAFSMDFMEPVAVSPGGGPGKVAGDLSYL